MTQPHWLTEEELQAWRQLGIMYAQLQYSLNRELAKDGLSYIDYLVLVVLTEQPDEQIRLLELAKQLGWEKSRMSHHISRMVSRGLVEKLHCKTDQRGTFVAITPEGKKTIVAAAPQHVAAVRNLFIDLLEPKDLTTLTKIANTVLENMEKF